MALVRTLALSLIVAGGIGADGAHASMVTIHTPAVAIHANPPTQMPVGIVVRGYDGKAFFCPAGGCYPRGAPHPHH